MALSPQRLLAEGLGRRLELAAVDEDLAFGADEQHAAAVAVDHLDAVGVEVAHAASWPSGPRAG